MVLYMMSVVLEGCGMACVVGAAVLVLDGRCEAMRKHVESYVFVVLMLVLHGVVVCGGAMCCVGMVGMEVMKRMLRYRWKVV